MRDERSCTNQPIITKLADYQPESSSVQARSEMAVSKRSSELRRYAEARGPSKSQRPPVTIQKTRTSSIDSR